MSMLQHPSLKLLAMFSAVLFSGLSHSEVKELNNTEMTEAYIQDDTIVVKQRNVEPKPAPKTHKVKIGAGTPVVSQVDDVREKNQQDRSQYPTLEQDLARSNSVEQILQFNQQQANQISIPVMDSLAAQAQQAHANDLVRNGLGLASDTTVTTDMLVQYLQTFAGQTSGSPTGPMQSITANGIQISIPNPGMNTGNYTSGDGNHNVDANNSQIIWNLIFPQGQP